MSLIVSACGFENGGHQKEMKIMKIKRRCYKLDRCVVS